MFADFYFCVSGAADKRYSLDAYETSISHAKVCAVFIFSSVRVHNDFALCRRVPTDIQAYRANRSSPVQNFYGRHVGVVWT